MGNRESTTHNTFQSSGNYNAENPEWKSVRWTQINLNQKLSLGKSRINSLKNTEKPISTRLSKIKSVYSNEIEEIKDQQDTDERPALYSKSQNHKNNNPDLEIQNHFRAFKKELGFSEEISFQDFEDLNKTSLSFGVMRELEPKISFCKEIADEDADIVPMEEFMSLRPFGTFDDMANKYQSKNLTIQKKAVSL